jgi:hypothetical protein
LEKDHVVVNVDAELIEILTVSRFSRMLRIIGLHGTSSLFCWAGAVRAPCRILPVVGAEDTIEVGGILLKG